MTNNQEPARVKSRRRCPVCRGQWWWPLYISWTTDEVYTCNYYSAAGIVPIVDREPLRNWLDQCVRCGTVVS